MVLRYYRRLLGDVFFNMPLFSLNYLRLPQESMHFLKVRGVYFIKKGNETILVFPVGFVLQYNKQHSFHFVHPFSIYGF